MRTVSTVMLEALVIGIMNASLFWSLKQMNLDIKPHWLLVIVGALIHIVFEYSGTNKWWCKVTYE